MYVRTIRQSDIQFHRKEAVSNLVLGKGCISHLVTGPYLYTRAP